MYRVAVTVFLLVLMVGCGSTTQDSDSPHSVVKTIENGEAVQYTLLGGTSVTFPANTFDEDTIIVFSDLFTDNDANPAYFPGTANTAGGLLGAMVVNTPADQYLANNLPVTFELIDLSGQAASAVDGVTAGQEFAVYKFDPDNLRWNRWGNTLVTVDSSMQYASGVLPTEGMLGYVGSLALFRGHGFPDISVAEKTYIHGTVRDNASNPVSTDVTLYVLIGANRYAFPIGNDDAFIPDIPGAQHFNAGDPIANAVMSDSDGNFTVEITDNLIGKLVNLSFGLADESFSGTDKFDVLTPGQEAPEVDYMRVSYGDNQTASRPVN